MTKLEDGGAVKVTDRALRRLYIAVEASVADHVKATVLAEREARAKECDELAAALEALHTAPYKLDALCGGSEYMAASARAEILLTHRRATAKQE